MKKFTVLLVAMAFAVSASAGVGLKANRNVTAKKVVKTEMTKKFKMSDLKAQAPKFGVMTEEPQGEKKYYNRAGSAIYISGQNIAYGEQGKQMEVVYAEDGKVYMKNILYQCNGAFGDSWVEGTVEGNEIHIPMGQSIYWSDQYQADVVLAMGETHVEEDAEGASLVFEPDANVTEAVYTIEGDQLILQNTYKVDTESEYANFYAYGLGSIWTDDASFGGFLEWNTVLTEGEAFVAPTVITEQPEGELKTFWRVSGTTYYSSWFGWGATETDGKFNVVFAEDGKVYVQNPVWYYDTNEAWVEGTYDETTGIISVPVGQFILWDDAAANGYQVVWGYSEIVDGEDGQYINYGIDTRTTEINYLVDGSSIYLLGSEGDLNAEFPYNLNTTGLMVVDADGAWGGTIEFALKDAEGNDRPFGQEVNNVPAVPANPTANRWNDSGSEGGMTYFNFTLPTTDVDGNMIDPECVSYSIYTDDDQLFTFDAATYSHDLSEDMTEIPYWIYSGGYDFSASTVYFYRTNMGDNPMFENRIGIQVHYTVDGVMNSSDIVYLEVAKPTPAVPANPSNLTWTDNGNENGMNRFGFTLPETDVDGNPIDQKYLSYSIFVDNDQIFTFDAETYSYDLTEDMTEIPYTIWGSGYDFYRGAVYFYRTNEGVNGEEPFFNHQIGIQVYYTVDGVKNASDIVYLEVYPDTKVNEINAGKDVANVRYYNMAGQEMAQPQGMTIKVTTYTDGTTSAVKVVK